MSAWLLQRPASVHDRHPRYFLEFDGRQARTTEMQILARRFHSATEARAFAAQYVEHLAEWRVVRR